MIGADAEAIDKAEDRQQVPRGDGPDRPRKRRARRSPTRVDEAIAALERTSGCRRSSARASRSAAPAAASPTTATSSSEIVRGGLDASPTTEVLIEESLLGWKEFEMEVVRDRARQCHHHLLDRECRSDGRPHRRFDHGRAGADADRQGISDHAQREHRGAARNRRRNRRFQRPVRGQSEGWPADRDRDEPARRRAPRRWPRRRPASRSPRSRPSWRSATRSTRSRTTSPAPPRPASSRRSTMSSPRSRASPSRSSRAPRPMLSTAMKSVGEVMAIGRNFQESLQKALRGLETGLDRVQPRARARRRAQRRDQGRAARSRRPTGCSVAAQAFREGFTRRRDPRDHPLRSRGSSPDRGDRRRGGRDLPRRPAARCRRAAAAEGDGLFRQAARRAGGALGRRRAAGWRETQARALGLLHDALKAMTGATTEDEVRALRHKLGVLPGVQADRHLRRRVRGEDALYVLDLRGAELRRARGREPAERPAARSSSSAAGRTGSGRGSSSTIAAATPASRSTEAGLRDDHDQLQPGDGLDRLRHVRPALFRAADRRGRARDPACRAVERRAASA